MRTHPRFLIAAAAALAAGSLGGLAGHGVKAQLTAQQVQAETLRLGSGGMTAPRGPIASMLSAWAFGSGGGGGGWRPQYGNRGHSVAHGKRMARKRRNQLRAKGHHRQAVR